MYYPDFFDEVETLTLRDPLASFLGTFSDGQVNFSYLDVVKAAGHSCPTVAGAYLMTLTALSCLYPDSLPVRGDIEVELKESVDEGTAGVVGSVVAHLTGAAHEGGFKGVQGRFSRRCLMRYGADIEGTVRFVRRDNNALIELSYHPENVPPDPRQPELMRQIAEGSATEATIKEFGKIWQERVRRILLDNRVREGLFRIVALPSSASI